MTDIVSPDDTPRKKCSKCDKEFPFTTEFFLNSRWGLTDICLTCNRESKREALGIEPVPDGYKRCSICKKPWPATTDFFTRCKRASDGLNGGCKKCRYERKDAKRNTPEGKEQQQEYYQENKERMSASHKQWHANNRDDANARHRRNHAKNKERDNQRSREYNHSERGKAAQRIGNHNRRVRMKEIKGTCTNQDVLDQLKRQHYCCYYAACGFSKFKKKKDGTYIYHLEHTYPVSRIAGTDIPGNDISYLVLSCKQCNDKKGNKFPWEFPEGGRLL